MLPAILASSVLFSPADHILDLAIASHLALPDYRMNISYSNERDKVTINSRQDKAVNLSIYLKTNTPREEEVFATANQVFLYRPELKQHTVRVGITNRLIQELSAVDLKLPQPISRLYSSKSTAEWLKQLKNLGGWELERSRWSWRLTREGLDGLDLISFSREATLLNEVKGPYVEIGRALLSIKPAEGDIPSAPPEDSVLVNAFNEQVLPPEYADDLTAQAGAKMLASLDNLTAIAYTLQNESESTRVLINGRRIRQTDDIADWVYDGSNIVLVSFADKAVYSGSVRPSRLLDVVAESGTRVETFLKRLMFRVNPLRQIVTGAAMSLTGTIKTGGSDAVILSAKTETRTFSIMSRSTDGRVLSIMTAIPQDSGSPMVVSQLKFAYEPDAEAKKEDAFTIVPPEGFAARPLSDLMQ
jgi:hypothetical protein